MYSYVWTLVFFGIYSPQAYIVHEAYGKQFDWSISIYYQVVEKGDFVYFEDYRSALILTDSLFRDVAQL